VAIPQVPESQRAAFEQRLAKLSQPGAEIERRSIYSAAVQTIERHPLTGVGPLAFGRLEDKLSDFPGLPADLLHAHNLFLESYLSLGPLGAIGLLWLLLGAIVGYFRAFRRRPAEVDDPATGFSVGALAALVALLVHGLVDFVYWQEEMLVLLMLLTGIGWRLRSDERPAKLSSS
jgi:O-antigen ligase